MDAARDVDDVPVNLHAFVYTVRQAALVSGALESSIYLWRDRNQLMAGNCVPYCVRFSVLDLIALTVMQRLTVRLKMAAMHAGRIAGFAAEIAAQLSRGPDGKLRGSSLGDNILIAFDADGGVVVGTANVKFPGHYMPPSFETDPANPLREPHIFIPVSAIRRNVVEAVCALAKEDDGE